MATLKVFKRYSTAKEHAAGRPIVRVGSGSSSIYIVGMHEIDEVAIIAADGSITGNVTMKHLDRLGNANHATAKKGEDYSHGRAYE